MDIHQKVQELRTRIERLRAQLELSNTNTNLEPASVVVEDPEPTQIEQPKQSAADEYKARLMKKKSS